MDRFRDLHGLDWMFSPLDPKQDRTQATTSDALAYSSTSSGPSQGRSHAKRKASSPFYRSADQSMSEGTTSRSISGTFSATSFASGVSGADPPPQLLHADYNDNDDGSDPDKTEQPRKKRQELGRRLSSEPEASDPRLKRKAQNREAQRAFRERRQKYVSQLEDQIKDLKAKHHLEMQQLQGELSQLRLAVHKLETENHQLKSATFPLGLPDQPKSESETAANHNPLQEAPRQMTGSSSTPSAIDKNGLSFLDANVTGYNFLNATAGLDNRFQDIGLSPVVGTSTDALVFAAVPDGQKGGQGVYHDGDKARRAANQTILWKKITEHPRYEEFDINDLLVKLRQRQEELISEDGKIDMENLASFLEQDFYAAPPR